MNSESTLAESRQRERSRVRWRAVRLVSVCTGLLSALASVLLVVAFLFSTTGEVLAAFQIAAGFSPILGALAVGSGIAVNEASKKERKKVDRRFEPDLYLLLTRFLRRNGIKDHVKYLVFEHQSISAFQRVYKYAINVVEAPPEYKGERDDLSDPRLYAATKQEAFNVASLVLPGEKELGREDQIRKLLMERGYTSYASIKELVDQTDPHPMVLNDGAL